MTSISRVEEVVWALTTRVDAGRDVLIVETHRSTISIFASPARGWGQRWNRRHQQMDAETSRLWGRPIAMQSDVKSRVDRLWKDLGL